MPSNNKRLTLRSHEAKTLEKASFLTLPIRTTNNWNKECLRGGVVEGAKCFIQDSHEAMFRTLEIDT